MRSTKYNSSYFPRETSSKCYPFNTFCWNNIDCLHTCRANFEKIMNLRKYFNFCGGTIFSWKGWFFKNLVSRDWLSPPTSSNYSLLFPKIPFPKIQKIFWSMPCPSRQNMNSLFISNEGKGQRDYLGRTFLHLVTKLLLRFCQGISLLFLRIFLC